jgi:cyclic-di-GMP-binding biofilm dispersal mediator protein
MDAARSLEGASVLLAGATGGIGSALGAHLAKAGARLTLFARSAAKLDALDLPGPRVAGDLGDGAACVAAVDAARTHHGRLDGVVNAAGLVAFGGLETLRDEVMDALVEANFVGPIRLARAALPHLERGGFLVQLSAVVAERPTAGMAFYSATKAALSAFDEAIARELRRREIQVLDVRPPHTETGLASRPIAGVAPRLAAGLSPDVVACAIVDALRAGRRELASTDFPPAPR